MQEHISDVVKNIKRFVGNFIPFLAVKEF